MCVMNENGHGKARGNTRKVTRRNAGATIDPTFARDVQESELPPDVLAELLKDRTTGRNILWMTDDYRKYESAFDCPMGTKDPILAEVISRKDVKIIRPRVDKSKEEQRERVTKKAEVFTPSWICNAMNNDVDASWFGLEESPFTAVKEPYKSWTAKKEPIPFPGANGETWKDFVIERRLEITCGEAPFLASRYDTTTGEMIPVPERMGILDRKLRVVTEQVGANRPKRWLNWAVEAVKATLGFEWQGDSLLIARENILMTVLEAYKFHCRAIVPHDRLLELAYIISWNIWQMDGLKFVIPLSCHEVEWTPKRPKRVQLDLFKPVEPPKAGPQPPLMKPCPGCAKKNPLDGSFDHNGIYCKVMDWGLEEPYLFVDHMRKGGI